ncbi:hypothetical protein ACFLUV_06395 [Elusimicrobiota bacterium]
MSKETKIHINELAKELTELEMLGRIKQIEGKRFYKN